MTAGNWNSRGQLKQPRVVETAAFQARQEQPVHSQIYFILKLTTLSLKSYRWIYLPCSQQWGRISLHEQQWGRISITWIYVYFKIVQYIYFFLFLESLLIMFIPYVYKVEHICTIISESIFLIDRTHFQHQISILSSHFYWPNTTMTILYVEYDIQK